MDLTRLWKGYKMPGRKVDLVVKTYTLEVTGMAKPERKPVLLFFSVLLEGRQLGVAPSDQDVAGL